MSQSDSNGAAMKQCGTYSGRLADSWRTTAALILLLMTCFGVLPSAIAADQATINLARDRSAAWLIKNQQGDGNWSTGGGTDIPVSAQALLGLVSANVKGFPVLNANAWLLNNKPESVDALSRLLLARASPAINETSGFQTLLSWRNTDITSVDVRLWGAYPQYTTSLPDTALAWRAILLIGYDLTNLRIPFLNTMCNTLNVQRGDGGWGLNLPPANTGGVSAPTNVSAGSVLATAPMVLMLHAARTKLTLGGSCGFTIATQVDTSITNSVTWLTTIVKNSDGGVGENGVSTNISTALAYLALQTVASTNPSPVTGALLDYMLARQDLSAGASYGSWNGDPMVTAVMLEALSKIATPAALDSDGDGIPDSIEVAMGTNPNIADTRSLASKGTGAGQAGITLPLMIANNIPVNVPFTGNVSVIGGTAPYTWSVTAGLLPPGLTLGASSVGTTTTITGTPTTLGAYVFEYSARDSTGATAKTIGQLTIVRALPGNGDVNGDGVVDIADVILAQRIALGQIVPTAEQKARADVAPAGEPDGVIDASDVLRILRKALGIDSF